MLNFLRNNTKVIVWFIVIIVGLLFGVSSFSLRKEDRFAGEVFGKRVTFQDFLLFQNMTRINPPSEEIMRDAALARQYVWQQLILAEEAKNMGIDVTEAEVVTELDTFLNLGTRRLTEKEYENLLSRLRLSPQEFESILKERLRIQKLINEKLPQEAEDAKEIAPEVIQERRQQYIDWMTKLYTTANLIDYQEKQYNQTEAVKGASL